jgi:PAS domain S-box-containing protein
MQPSTLIDRTPSGQLFVALDGKFLYANASFWKTVRSERSSSLETIHLQDFLTPGGAIFYETQFVQILLLRGFISEISLELVRKDATHVAVLVNAALSTNAEGKPDGIILALFEATQRRQYEIELLKARRELEQVAEVVQRSSDAILSLTGDGLIQSWNSGAEHMFGFSSSEIVGKGLLSLFEEHEQSEIRKAIESVKNGVERKLDTVGLHRSGETVEIAISLTPHLEPPGIVVAFSAIIRDITARKRTERALLQNEKLASVGRLASSIAHEINNPLEAVTNLLYILESRVSDPVSKTLVTTAQEELARVSYIATHTLKFHKQSSSRTLLDLAALGDSVLGLYRARLQNSGISVVNDCAEASPLLCFEGELRQILANVVSNAFDAMRGGGRLVLRCRDVTFGPSGSKGVRLTVADTGSGMDSKTLSRVFEPFFSTKGIGGTGLGMWITEELIHKNGGTIKVRSDVRAGKSGTVVSMCFPHRTTDVSST